MGRHAEQLARQRDNWTLSLRRSRCPKDGGRVLETQMPEAVCSKCGTRYILAIQSGFLLMRSQLVEVTRDSQPVNITVPSIKEREVKETIIKEVVKIPCRYCGGLMPQTDNFCANCGGRRQ